MRSADSVVVREFSNMVDAEVAASVLKAAGIPVSIEADDAGRMRPHMQLSLGVRLLVPARAAKVAKELLEVGAE
jgi:Putative prokaryotic signal transducing protein